jgi:signal transduction histidine kinase
MQYHDIQKTITKAISSISQIAVKKEVKIINKNLHAFSTNYDEDRILQVLTNLLSNAIKFCSPKTGIIEIDFKLGNAFVEISVIDNGKGIPVEDHDFIFDKFYQSQDQNTRKPQGSGLGLAITKQIVDKHNGKIWAKKGLKKGATLVFTIPFK